MQISANKVKKKIRAVKFGSLNLINFPSASWITCDALHHHRASHPCLMNLERCCYAHCCRWSPQKRQGYESRYYYWKHYGCQRGLLLRDSNWYCRLLRLGCQNLFRWCVHSCWRVRLLPNRHDPASPIVIAGLPQKPGHGYPTADLRLEPGFDAHSPAAYSGNHHERCHHICLLCSYPSRGRLRDVVDCAANYLHLAR